MYDSVKEESLNLVERAVKNAKAHKAGNSPMWVAVMDAFALGSTSAQELCKRYDLDPRKEVSGVRCIACNP